MYNYENKQINFRDLNLIAFTKKYCKRFLFRGVKCVNVFIYVLKFDNKEL